MEKERIREAAMKKKNGFSRLVRIWCILFVIAVVGLGLCGGAFWILKDKKSSQNVATAYVYINQSSAIPHSGLVSVPVEPIYDYLRLVEMKSTLTGAQKAACTAMDSAGDDSTALAKLSVEELQSMVRTGYDTKTRRVEISVTAGDERSSGILADALAQFSAAFFNEAMLGGLPYAEYDGNVEVKTLTWGEVWSCAKQGDNTDRKATE